MKNHLTLWVSALSFLTALASPLRSASQQRPDRQNTASEVESTRSAPPDLTSYVRRAIPQDYAPGGKPALPLARILGTPVFPGVYLADAVVNNTDPNLKNTDTFNDTEPSLALNPATCGESLPLRYRRGCLEIVLLAFSGGWDGQGSFAPLWLSTNGGTLWTKEFTIPIPPNAPNANGCPCDQTPDYGKANQMSATFLVGNSNDGYNVFSGTTSNPDNGAQWNWLISGGVAQPTNSYGDDNADQPWLLVNRDPDNQEQNDVYVDYDDFSGAPDMRVAVAYGTDPPNFTTDSLEGFSTGGINPGHRLAVDHRNGAVYSLFQRCLGNCTSPKNINYILNRSMDGGLTWLLNGSPTGVVVATGQSTQPTPKFGTVNALLGGVDHLALDPSTGNVYVVYGNRDPNTGNNRLSIVRLTDDGKGGLNIGEPSFVTGQVQAALPSVAVAEDIRGAVGVLYDTFDGIDGSGYPTFSAHLAISVDHGTTFHDVTLETFLSPATDNGNARQRVLGDYHQLKSVGNGFYGVFTGNGVPFGRPYSNTDPIFFKTSVRQ